MPWVRMDDGYPEHPKTIAAGHAAAWLNTRAWCWANRNLTDGFIPSEAVPHLVAPMVASGEFVNADPEAIVRRLLDKKLWERVGGGYMIHDYLEYNNSRRVVIRTRKKRADAGRIGGSKRQANTKQKSSKTQPHSHSHSHSPTQTQVQGPPLITPPVSPGDTTKTPPSRSWAVEFEVFWSAWAEAGGAKEGRGKAEEAYQTHVVRRGAALPNVLTGVAKWRTSQKWADGFVTMPVTWLNQHRWEDEPKQVSPLSPAGRATLEAGRRFAERMRERLAGHQRENGDDPGGPGAVLPGDGGDGGAVRQDAERGGDGDVLRGPGPVPDGGGG